MGRGHETVLPGSAGLDLASLHERRLSSSRVPVAQETAWKGSTASSALGSLSATTSAIQRAPPLLDAGFYRPVNPHKPPKSLK